MTMYQIKLGLSFLERASANAANVFVFQKNFQGLRIQMQC